MKKYRRRPKFFAYGGQPQYSKNGRLPQFLNGRQPQFLNGIKHSIFTGTQTIKNNASKKNEVKIIPETIKSKRK